MVSSWKYRQMSSRCSGKCLRSVLAMLWSWYCYSYYYYICCAAAAGRQAGPRHVFSGAVAAIFPTTNDATYWTEILPRCCRSAMSLRVPMQSLMPFSIDCHGWFLCCTCVHCSTPVVLVCFAVVVLVLPPRCPFSEMHQLDSPQYFVI